MMRKVKMYTGMRAAGAILIVTLTMRVSEPASGEIIVLSQSANVSATACETSGDSTSAIGPFSLSAGEFCDLSSPDPPIFDFLSGGASITMTQPTSSIFDVVGGTSASSGCCSGGSAGAVDYMLTFQLTTDTPYMFVGEVEAIAFFGSSSSASVTLMGPGGVVHSESISSSGGPDSGGTIMFDESGILTAGTYSIAAMGSSNGGVQADFVDGDFAFTFVVPAPGGLAVLCGLLVPFTRRRRS